MSDKLSFEGRIAEKIQPFLDEIGSRVAKLQRPVYGNVHVDKEEQRRRFWQIEKGWTPEQEMALLQGGMTPQDVGLLKYPYREIDSKAGGRHDDEMAQYTYMQEHADLGPPPPEPLQAAAQATEHRQSADELQKMQEHLATLDPAPAAPTAMPMAPVPGVPTTTAVAGQQGGV